MMLQALNTSRRIAPVRSILWKSNENLLGVAYRAANSLNSPTGVRFKHKSNPPSNKTKTDAGIRPKSKSQQTPAPLSFNTGSQPKVQVPIVKLNNEPFSETAQNREYAAVNTAFEAFQFQREYVKAMYDDWSSVTQATWQIWNRKIHLRFLSRRKAQSYYIQDMKSHGVRLVEARWTLHDRRDECYRACDRFLLRLPITMPAGRQGLSFLEMQQRVRDVRSEVHRTTTNGKLYGWNFGYAVWKIRMRRYLTFRNVLVGVAIGGAIYYEYAHYS